MATETVIQRPAPFIEKLGTNLAENILAQQGTPVVTGGLASLGAMAQPDKQDFETDKQFEKRKELFDAQRRAAVGFEQRQQALKGLAPEVAKQDALQTRAQELATQGVGSFSPFLQKAQAAAADAGTALGGVGLGAQAFQQDVQNFMSPYQSQVIDATLAEFDRNKAIQEQSIRDQQAALGALGAGRAGVQLAEFGTGAARERALLQAGLLQQGFGQAQAARQQDIANRFGLAQAQSGIAGQLQGLGGFRSGLAGQQAQFGQGLQALQGTDIARLGQLGALNQAQRQAELDAQREATRQATFLPQEQLDRFGGQVASLMGGYPGGTTATNVPNPTPLQTALGVGTTLAGIYGGLTGKLQGNFNFGPR